MSDDESIADTAGGRLLREAECPNSTCPCNNKNASIQDRGCHRTSRPWGCKVLLTVSLILNALTFFGLTAFLVWYSHFSGKDPGTSPRPPPYTRPCPVQNFTSRLDLALTSQSSDTLGVCWPYTPAEPRMTSPYRLLVDDWWLFSHELKVAYAGKAQEFEMKDLLPGVPYRMQLVAVPFRQPEQMGQVWEFHTAERPYCGNLQDLLVHRNATANNMPGRVKTCILNSGGSQQASVDCIIQMVGLTVGCATCWAGELRCILTRCLLDCMSPESAACHHCLDTKCVPAVAECAGLPLWVYNITDIP